MIRDAGMGRAFVSGETLSAESDFCDTEEAWIAKARKRQ
jgi:hypothetical protein